MTLALDLIRDDDEGGEDPDGYDYFKGPVLTATRWRNNAHMIACLARWGRYLRDDWVTVDATANSLKWWKDWRPRTLITNDLDLRFNTDHHADFRALPFPDGTPETGIDVEALDPPYVSVGGRRTTTFPDFNTNYGLDDVPTTPDATRDLICDGLTEAARILRVRHVGVRARRAGTDHPGGILLLKCKNYVSSATLQPTVVDVINHARGIPGLRFEDWFLHLTNPMAQPKKRGKNKNIESPQGHARSNCSHLLVFRRVA